jgi:hypothetical protein
VFNSVMKGESGLDDDMLSELKNIMNVKEDEDLP